MPAKGNIVLADGQSTPVNHTFAPSMERQDVQEFADRSGGIPVGFPVLTVSLRKPANGNGNGAYKAVLKVVVPTLEQTSPSTTTGIQPAPTVAYNCVANVDMILPGRSTLQERKNLLAYIKNALSHADLVKVIQDLDPIY